MTAEVAVMNRIAVALAADSAVTIQRGDSTKIFQSENKLFQLSESKPIGIMIYNSTGFFDIPWELIIKDFRADNKDLAVSKLFDVVPLFLEYVTTRFLPNEEQQANYIQNILEVEFASIYSEFSKKTVDELFSTKKRSPEDQDKLFRPAFNAILDARLDARRSYSSTEEMTIEEGMKAIQHYQLVYDETYSRYFSVLPLYESENDKIKEIAARVVIGIASDNYMTGLVFAGFGDDEIFPSLECIEVNGVVLGKLKKVHLEKIDIDRREKTGAVIPFAQREAADSLLYGRSDSYEYQVVRHFENVISQIGCAIVDACVKKPAKRNEVYQDVKDATKEAINRFNQSVAPKIKGTFFNDILDTIRHMPKPELAAFAEALVSVTSIKRKVSVGPETVGGPIDVAVISRHEGFVWVKRKLYFPADLNPRFAWRSRRQSDEARN